jgi:hypothetical protein
VREIYRRRVTAVHRLQVEIQGRPVGDPESAGSSDNRFEEIVASKTGQRTALFARTVVIECWNNFRVSHYPVGISKVPPACTLHFYIWPSSMLERPSHVRDNEGY